MIKQIVLVVFLCTAMAMIGYANDKTASVNPQDKHFMLEAASGGQMEVQLGQTAEQKATNPDVKNFGHRMATDHSKANSELQQLAQQKDVTLPSDLQAPHKEVMDQVSKQSGDAFDKTYMRNMVKDHAEDVAKFQKMSTQAQDPDLKRWVSKTLPTLEEHLRMAQTVAKKVGVDTDQAVKEGQDEAAKSK
jgi:putative membrane protein